MKTSFDFLCEEEDNEIEELVPSISEIIELDREFDEDFFNGE